MDLCYKVTVKVISSFSRTVNEIFEKLIDICISVQIICISQNDNTAFVVKRKIFNFHTFALKSIFLFCHPERVEETDKDHKSFSELVVILSLFKLVKIHYA